MSDINFPEETELQSGVTKDVEEVKDDQPLVDSGLFDDLEIEDDNVDSLFNDNANFLNTEDRINLAKNYIQDAAANIQKLNYLYAIRQQLSQKTVDNLHNAASALNSHYNTTSNTSDKLEIAIAVTDELIKAIKAGISAIEDNCTSNVQYDYLLTKLNNMISDDFQYYANLANPITVKDYTLGSRDLTLDELYSLLEAYTALIKSFRSYRDSSDITNYYNSKREPFNIKYIENSSTYYFNMLDVLYNIYDMLTQNNLDISYVKGIYKITGVTKQIDYRSKTDKLGTIPRYVFECSKLFEPGAPELPDTKTLVKPVAYNTSLHAIQLVDIKRSDSFDIIQEFFKCFDLNISSPDFPIQRGILPSKYRTERIELPIVIFEDNILYLTPVDEEDSFSVTDFLKTTVDLNRQSLTNEIILANAAEQRAKLVSDTHYFTVELEANASNYSAEITINKTIKNNICMSNRVTKEELAEDVRNYVLEYTIGSNPGLLKLQRICLTSNGVIQESSVEQLKELCKAYGVKYIDAFDTDISYLEQTYSNLQKILRHPKSLPKDIKKDMFGDNDYIKSLRLSHNITSARVYLRNLILKYKDELPSIVHTIEDYYPAFEKHKTEIIKDYFAYIVSYIEDTCADTLRKIFKQSNIDNTLIHNLLTVIESGNTEAFSGRLKEQPYYVVEDYFNFYTLLKHYNIIETICLNYRYNKDNIQTITVDDLLKNPITLEDLWGYGLSETNNLMPSSTQTCMIYLAVIQLCMGFKFEVDVKGDNMYEVCKFSKDGIGKDKLLTQEEIAQYGILDHTEYRNYLGTIIKYLMQTSCCLDALNNLPKPMSLDFIIDSYIRAMYANKRDDIAFSTQLFYYHPDMLIAKHTDALIDMIASEFDIEDDTSLIDLLLAVKLIYKDPNVSKTNYKYHYILDALRDHLREQKAEEALKAWEEKKAKLKEDGTDLKTIEDIEKSEAEKRSNLTVRLHFARKDSPFATEEVKQAYESVARTLLRTYTINPGFFNLFVEYIVTYAEVGFTDCNTGVFLRSIGFPSSVPADFVKYPTYHIEESLQNEYNIKLLYQDILKGSNNSTIVRDYMVLKAIFCNPMKRLIQSYNQDTEDLYADQIAAQITKTVTRFASYQNVEKRLSSIVVNAGGDENIIPDALAIIKSIAPSNIDISILLGELSNTLNIALNSEDTDLYGASVKPDVTESALLLQQQCNQLSKTYNILQAVSPFTTKQKYEKILKEYLDAKEKLNSLFVKPISLVIENSQSKRDSIRSQVLYKRYLQTGDKAYLKDVNRDYVSFELLTYDQLQPDGKGVFGEYSPRRITERYGLADSDDSYLQSQYATLPYSDLLTVIIADNPGALLELPKAIRDYYDNATK